mgnify:FL=1
MPGSKGLCRFFPYAGVPRLTQWRRILPSAGTLTTILLMGCWCVLLYYGAYLCVLLRPRNNNPTLRVHRRIVHGQPRPVDILPVGANKPFGKRRLATSYNQCSGTGKASVLRRHGTNISDTDCAQYTNKNACGSHLPCRWAAGRCRGDAAYVGIPRTSRFACQNRSVEAFNALGPSNPVHWLCAWDDKDPICANASSEQTCGYSAFPGVCHWNKRTETCGYYAAKLARWTRVTSKKGRIGCSSITTENKCTLDKTDGLCMWTSWDTQKNKQRCVPITTSKNMCATAKGTGFCEKQVASKDTPVPCVPTWGGDQTNPTSACGKDNPCAPSYRISMPDPAGANRASMYTYMAEWASIHTGPTKDPPVTSKCYENCWKGCQACQKLKPTDAPENLFRKASKVCPPTNLTFGSHTGLDCKTYCTVACNALGGNCSGCAAIPGKYWDTQKGKCISGRPKESDKDNCVTRYGTVCTGKC